MPGILHLPVARRDFLKATALSAFALTLGGAASTPSRSARPGELHLALLSDTHLPGDRKNGYRGFNPWENLRRIAPDVASVRPEGVILCGDAARLDGQIADYEELKTLLEPIAVQAPIFIGLGNHDDRANFNKVFPAPTGLKQTIRDKHVLVLEHEPVRVVVLDSLLYVNRVAGLLGREQRQWLADYLPAHPDRPIVLFVHHTLADNDGDLLDADRLFNIIRPHPQVKAIFFGHSHVWGITQRDRVTLINLPAVGYNFRDQDPVGWVDARFDAKGADLTLRAFGGNQTADGTTTRVNW